MHSSSVPGLFYEVTLRRGAVQLIFRCHDDVAAASRLLEQWSAVLLQAPPVEADQPTLDASTRAAQQVPPTASGFEDMVAQDDPILASLLAEPSDVPTELAKDEEHTEEHHPLGKEKQLASQVETTLAADNEAASLVTATASVPKEDDDEQVEALGDPEEEDPVLDALLQELATETEDEPIGPGPLPSAASLQVLFRLPNPGNVGMDEWLLRAAYYAVNTQQKDQFALRELNDVLEDVGQPTGNHAALQLAVSKGWLQLVPDRTGMAAEIQYQLTEVGEQAMQQRLFQTASR